MTVSLGYITNKQKFLLVLDISSSSNEIGSLKLLKTFHYEAKWCPVSVPPLTFLFFENAQHTTRIYEFNIRVIVQGQGALWPWKIVVHYSADSFDLSAVCFSALIFQ